VRATVRKAHIGASTVYIDTVRLSRDAILRATVQHALDVRDQIALGQARDDVVPGHAAVPAVALVADLAGRLGDADAAVLDQLVVQARADVVLGAMVAAAHGRGARWAVSPCEKAVGAVGAGAVVDQVSGGLLGRFAEELRVRSRDGGLALTHRGGGSQGGGGGVRQDKGSGLELHFRD
jgi:hypothetical protein